MEEEEEEEEKGGGGWRRSRVLRSVAGASAPCLRTWKRTMPEKTTTAFLAMASSLSMTTLVRWMTMKELVLTRKPEGKRGHGKYSYAGVSIARVDQDPCGGTYIVIYLYS